MLATMAAAGIWQVVGCQYPPYNISIDRDTKRTINLLCDSWTSKMWIAPFHFDNCIDDFS